MLQLPIDVPCMGPVSLSRACMTVARIICVILILFRLPQISCFIFSLKCFCSNQNSCPDVGIGPLLQFPNPPRAGPVLLTILFFLLIPSSYPVLKVKVTHLCPPLCNPMDYTVHGILQARILEWVAYPFSSRSSRPRNRTGVSSIPGGFFTNWAILGKPTEFCMVLYILFWWPCTPYHSQLVFCKHFCVRRCIPDVSMERNIFHIHLLLCHLVPLQLLFLNCWFLPSILSLFAPCILMTLLLGTHRFIVFITSWWIRPFIIVQCFSLFPVSFFYALRYVLSDTYIATKTLVYLLHLFNLTYLYLWMWYVCPVKSIQIIFLNPFCHSLSFILFIDV